MPDVGVPSPAGPLRGYLGLPTGAGPWPGVLVVHDAFGLGDTIRGHADLLAAAGYLTVAPDLYSSGRKPKCVVATMRALGAGRGRAFDDIGAARGWLAGREDCTGRVGVIGFCMGGGFALACAPRQLFDAAAPSYGQLPKGGAGGLRGSCPVVASFGGRDRTLRGAAETLERILTELGVDHDVKEYPDAGHSFMERHNVGPLGHLIRVTGMGYDHDAAEDAWRRILTFFAEHLSAR